MKILPMAACLFAATLPLAAPSFAEPPATPILALTVERADCPWLGMTDSYAQEQSNQFIRAADLDGATNGFLPALAEFTRPDVLMLRDIQKKQVVVNRRYFGDLERGDATRLPIETTHALGRFLDLSFARLSPRQLVLLLVKAQIIETYWHIEADLKLMQEEDLPDVYRAWFRGVHTYFTNDQNTDPIAFAVAIDKKTGDMTLVGGDVFDVDGPPAP